MEHVPPVDALSNEELAAHLRTLHAVVPRDIEDRERMLSLHAAGVAPSVPHEHDIVSAGDPAPAQPVEGAWRGRALWGRATTNGLYVALIEFEDEPNLPDGTVVTVLVGDGLRG